jgi:hypothetical protein
MNASPNASFMLVDQVRMATSKSTSPWQNTPKPSSCRIPQRKPPYSNLPGAIATAGATLGPGDVLLVEQQAVGPHGGTFYVPAEWDPAVYDAIRVVTQAGVIVVEAAGNGGENLDDAAFNGRFDRSKFDSDAIIVGAGSQAHARSPFSSYGSRVDLQGWGCCVVTTGYGDLFGSSRVTFYTRAFAGTSSASAMVAAAAGAVQGFARVSLG